MVKIKRTLCASCEMMWDGFGLPCPRKECSANTKSCSEYKRMTDDQLMHFAPQFWNDTFVQCYLDKKEAKSTDRIIEWQPVRPLLSELQYKQLTLF